jgi:hypothetical protein
MSLDTLRQIALDKSKKQPQQIDHLTEEAPILDVVPFQAATHDMWHAAEQVISADSMSFVTMDQPLPSVSSDTALIRFDLAKMGGLIEVTEDKARQYGGHTKYIADKLAPVLKMTGMSTERVITYNNLRQYALDQFLAGKTTRTVYSAGGSANANYSIIAVRFEEGVCGGLYNPNGFGDGVMFDTEPLNGGTLYKINSAGQLGYGARLKTDLGFMITGVRNVSVIVNIDPANNHMPTAAQIDDMLADIRATDSGRTMLLMHTRLKGRMCSAFKDSRVQMRPADKVIDRQLDSWGGVPFVTSYNMYDGSEANQAIA